ncbi:hypothetical protein [Streptomyces viridochromogenes]|uniref:hypothetical protein n=1 Tax=Streptomyces viridochromogenes TaxID=1938 RepID=UPI00065CA4BF|nr:hypothetical protein [Streptomyces viridochromogenes]
MLGLVGALLLVGGGALTAHAYSNARQEIPNDESGKVLWRDEPVDKIFPTTLGGRGGYNGGLYDREQAIWNRAGISPETDCDKGITRYTLKAAQENGCKAVLRATYVDSTANMVATVAVVVLPEGPFEAGPREKVSIRPTRTTSSTMAWLPRTRCPAPWPPTGSTGTAPP